MGAPKGNQFWKLRSKHGRDKLFQSPELMWEAACEYFQWCIETPLEEEEILKYKDTYEKVNLSKMRPFTLIGVCHYMGCNEAYFRQFEDTKEKDFSTVITRIRETIYKQKFEGAAAGFLNANIIARDLGLSDKRDLNIKSEQPLFGED